jgi:ATP-dependent protease HslVU (ClpYQ) peptidase subunit
MTLIIGILCNQGVVMAADGAATFSSSVTSATIRQPVKKLKIIDNRIIMGVSGFVGLGQLLQKDVEEYNNSGQVFKASHTAPEKVMVDLRNKFWINIKREMLIAKEAQDFIPNAAGNAITMSLLAAPIGNKPNLIEFGTQAEPEMKTADLPFACIGAGKAIADPFLAFLKRIFWQNGQLPNLSDGTFAAIWTIQHAIDIHPGGVAEPKQFVILEQKQITEKVKDWHARELTEEELGEHLQAIEIGRAHV